MFLRLMFHMIQQKWVAAAIFVELSVKDVTWNQIDEF